MRPEDFTDVLYDVEDDVAVITINRPERYNAFRGRTVDELITAFKLAWSRRTSPPWSSPAPATGRSARAAT